MKFVIVLSALLFYPAILTAQSEPDSSADFPQFPPVDIYSTRFEKQSVTSFFHNRLHYLFKSDQWNFLFRNNFTSTITDLSQKSVKEEFNTDFLTGYSMNNWLTAGIGVKRVSQSDSRSVELNASSINRYRLYLDAKPEEYLDAAVYGGYAAHRQTDQYNEGFLYGSDIYLNPYTIENAVFSGNIIFSNEDILPRRFLNRNLQFTAENSFAEGLRSILSIRYISSRRDFYLTALPAIAQFHNITKNIQNRLEDKTEFTGSVVSDALIKHVSSQIDFSISSRTVERNFRYKPPVITNSSGLNSELDDFRVQTGGRVSLDYNSFRLLFRGSYARHEEKNFFPDEPLLEAFTLQEYNKKEQEKNFIAERISIGTSFLYNISGGEELLLDLSHNKYVYDTPSDANYDDRDELLSVARVEYRNSRNAKFLWSAGLEGYISKNVYIFAERSANNSVNRFLRYFADNTFTLGTVTSRNHIEVSALYTVYDYEDLIPNFRSLSFRQFLFNDSTYIKIKGPLGFQSDLTLKMSEQGILNWNSFSTHPEREVHEFLLYPKLIYSLGTFSLFGGYRYLEIKVSRFEELTPIPLDAYYSRGPGAGLRYTKGEEFLAEFGIHQERIAAGNAEPRITSNINIAVQWYF